jgi:crossover junction endodeoxyribonuclease RusA
MILTLPWPPSVNKYWRRVGHKTILSRAGRDYRATVVDLLRVMGCPPIGPGPLRLVMDCHPPDRRRRDLDNLPKGVLDALQAAGVIENDGDIDSLTINRCYLVEGGRLTVTIGHIGGKDA